MSDAPTGGSDRAGAAGRSPLPVPTRPVVAAASEPPDSSRPPLGFDVDPNLMRMVAQTVVHKRIAGPRAAEVDMVYRLREVVSTIQTHSELVIMGYPDRYDWGALADYLTDFAHACRQQVIIDPGRDGREAETDIPEVGA